MSTKDVSTARPVSLVAKIAERYSVDQEKLLNTLKATAFKQRDGAAPSNEQMMALLVVADQYKLNPFTKEIYAFPDKQNGIVPVVGVDGWSRIINSHPQFNGMEFRYSDEKTTPQGAKSECHEWVECVIHRKDREYPTVVREYLDEVYRAPFEKKGNNGQTYMVDGPWQTHPKRFLRHKATIQCARLALGFVGIYDQDEAERIVERDMGVITPEPAGETQKSTYGGVRSKEDARPEDAVIVEEELVTPKHAAIIRTRLIDSGVSELEFCQHFEIDCVEALPRTKVNEALAWAQGG